MSLAKEFRINSAGEEEQPNANKASTCVSNVERQKSSSCDDEASYRLDDNVFSFLFITNSRFLHVTNVERCNISSLVRKVHLFGIPPFIFAIFIQNLRLFKNRE